MGVTPPSFDTAGDIREGDRGGVLVAVVATYPAVRAGLQALLDGTPGIHVLTAPASRGPAATGAGPSCDVVVADLGDDPEGVRALLARLFPDVPAVLLAAMAEDHRPEPGAATGYLLRQAGAEEIAAAVRAVALGLAVYDPVMLAAAPLRQTAASDSDVDPLTDRELDVLRLMALGLPNKGIAYRLSISEHTVKFHVGAILGKLGAAGRTEAVMLAARRGLVPL